MQLRTRYVAALAATFVLAGAAPAAADSIAYVKDGNVWLSTSDASRQYQVTSTGGYSDVSQADDGTMIALSGVRLHRLDRQGKVLADFDTPVSDTRPAGSRVFFGPFDPAVSPNGSKLAYTYYYMTQSQNPTCFPPEEFGRLRRSLVFVGSLDDFGVLGEALGGTPDWHGEHDEATGIWWFRDEASGNLFVHGCHPSAARRGHLSAEALDRTVLLARNLLPRLA